MRARIIFRGLTLFTFERSSRGVGPGANLGVMTALLINDRTHAGNPLHNHTPRWAALAREVDDPNGPGHTGLKRHIGSDTLIELRGTAQTGVTVDGSFLDYVPCLAELHWFDGGTTLNPDFISRRIRIPHGHVRAGEFISWDWYGKTPAKVGYMDTLYGGYGTNEVIVDIGDDEDIDVDNPNHYLSIRDHKLWPLAKGPDFVDDIDPNTAEVVISNLPARRRRPVFWSVHYSALFQAAGYPGRNYTASDQYTTFRNAALAYDADEWANDEMMVQAGQPFPFIADVGNKLDPIAEAEEPYMIEEPPPSPPSTRQRHQGISARAAHGLANMNMPAMPNMNMADAGSTTASAAKTETAGAGEAHAGHDPQNTQICPFGRE